MDVTPVFQTASSINTTGSLNWTLVERNRTSEFMNTSWTSIDDVISTVNPFSSTTDENEVISDELRHIFEISNFVVLSGIISFAGLIANIINIIVFVKQGLKDSISISLLGLAISDFGALITLVWMSICFNPYFAEWDAIHFNSPKVQYITAGWPHVCFARITSFITAYITLERCLCIAVPMKVKHILTPRRTFFVVLTIFITLIASVLPVYYAIRLELVYNEDRNKTLIDLVYVDDGPFIENVSFCFNVASQISSVVVVFICSLVLVLSLRKTSKWRQKLTGVLDISSTRDKKIVKMVLFLATIFIACFLPSAINLIIMISSAEYSIVGKYKNLFQVSWSFLNTLEATNSSINIFVYYRMSSNYRKVFRSLFCVRRIYASESSSSGDASTNCSNLTGH